jgi:hypothetical protein
MSKHAGKLLGKYAQLGFQNIRWGTSARELKRKKAKEEKKNGKGSIRHRDKRT